MDCDIFLVGLNHRTAGVDVRERFALVNHCDEEHWALPCAGAVSEAMILSTCNRVELLAAGTGDVSGQVLECWARARGAKADELRPYVYIHQNLEAVRHLFSVASSLDSASFSLAQTVTSKLDRSGNVSTGLRIACCLVLTMVPLSVMFVKADFSALKSLAILVSIPFMFVMIFMEIVLFKWLREDGKK